MSTVFAERRWFPARALTRDVIRRPRRTARRLAILGGGPGLVADVLAPLAVHSTATVVGVFDERRQKGAQHGAMPLDSLLERIRRGELDELLIYMPEVDDARLREILDRLGGADITVYLFSPKAQVAPRLGLPVLTVYSPPSQSQGHALKSLFDRGAALALILLLGPLLAAIALAVRLSSPGPILFRQPRYGLGNRLFSLYKFRTMYTDRTDVGASKLVTRDDPRVTPIGRFLRKSSLDELPQLFNVLKGEMSLVGPRPHAVKASAEGLLYEEIVSNYAARHRVKPGITGLAQVHGWRGETDTREKIEKRVEYDLAYIHNWSLWLDVKILLKTLVAVWVAENAY